MPDIIPKDKLEHLIVGALVAALGIAIAVVAQAAWPSFYKAHPWFLAAILAGAMVGAAKEGEDRLDNLLMHARGEAPIHGVEWLDFLATMAGSVAVALAALAVGIV